MIRTKRRKSKALPATYAELIALFPLRPLHDEVDYDNALEMAEVLVGSAGLSEDQADYLDVLADIIQKYEGRRHAVCGGGTALDILKRMLKEQGLTGSDLGRLLGNRPLGGAILRGERKLSKAHIQILAEYFKVSTDLFFD
jgi:antitoxin component HigA of HigAB toxin-antitoxin module